MAGCSAVQDLCVCIWGDARHGSSEEMEKGGVDRGDPDIYGSLYSADVEAVPRIQRFAVR